MKSARIFLTAAAFLSFDLSLFECALAVSPKWSVGFVSAAALGINPQIRSAGVLAMGGLFAIAGAYALSGAGVIRRLPLLRLVLLASGLSYLLGGIPFLPRLLVVLDLATFQGVVRLEGVVTALVFLIAGFVYLAGLSLSSRHLADRAQADQKGPMIAAPAGTEIPVRSGGRPE